MGVEKVHCLMNYIKLLLVKVLKLILQSMKLMVKYIVW